MSGTSCDGLDVALIEVRNDGYEVRWLALKEFAYSDAWAARMRGLGTLPEREVRRLEQEWTDWVLNHMGPQLKAWSEEFGPLHLVGFSGHTWYHEPAGRGTCAIGDAARLQAAWGMPVVADYRSADVAAGGQGAPLVPLFDALLFKEHAACLNLGGVANVTVRQSDGVIRASDLCGCNLLLNRQALRLGIPLDRDGRGAAEGQCSSEALAALDSWSHLTRPWPKSLAAEDLGALHAVLDACVRPEDALATGVHWVAKTVAEALEAQSVTGSVMATGGGAHHPVLVRQLREELTRRNMALNIPDLRWVDGKEAAAFAWLAWRTAMGRTTSLATVTGAATDVCGGVLYGNFTPPGMNGPTSG